LANKSRVQQLPQGQFIVTIPRALAEALRIRKGDVMEWVIENGDLILKRIKE
jgi:bifunctional DNA-binding transcriptional regulator/antitoxin component of YhaV-PrlF toxin-antitoxin module